MEGLAENVRDLDDIIAIVIGIRRLDHAVHHLIACQIEHFAAVLVVGIILCVVFIFVELQPEIGKLVGGIVEIGDGFRSGKDLFVLVEVAGDVVIATLLPVFGSRCAAGRAVFVRGRENGPEGLEFVPVVGCWIILNILRL